MKKNASIVQFYQTLASELQQQKQCCIFGPEAMTSFVTERELLLQKIRQENPFYLTDPDEVSLLNQATNICEMYRLFLS